MNRLLRWAACPLLLASVGCALRSPLLAVSPVDPRVIVRFQTSTTDQQARSICAQAGLTVLKQADSGIWLARAQAGVDWHRLPGHFRQIRAIELDRSRGRQMVGGFMQPLSGWGLIGLHLLSTGGVPDPYLSGLPGQWGLDSRGVDAQVAWNNGLQGNGVLVAVIDTGIDASHPDLQGQISPLGRNFVEGGSTPPDDDFGHGTHVAGIIAALPNPVTTDSGSQASVKGVAPGAKILPIRVLGTDQGDVFTEIQGIQYAVASGAKVINLSLGSNHASDIERSVIEQAIAAGVVVVAAAGNDALTGNPAYYPASYPGVLSVTAADIHHQRAGFADFNPLVSVAAPGVDILSCVPVKFGTFAYASGTSMAAPMISGMAALLLGAHPAWTPAQVAAAIENDVTPLSSSPELGTVGFADASQLH